MYKHSLTIISHAFINSSSEKNMFYRRTGEHFYQRGTKPQNKQLSKATNTSGIESNSSHVSIYSLKEWRNFFPKSNKVFKKHPRSNNISIFIAITEQLSIFKPMLINSSLLHLKTSALVQGSTPSPRVIFRFGNRWASRAE